MNDALIEQRTTAAAELLVRYKQIRATTEQICRPLTVEDYVVQPIVDVSPPKWHLAHTTWFFENFILAEYTPNYTIYSADYNYMFNSYYESMGERALRPNRGNSTRPTVEEIYAYRKLVDENIEAYLASNPELTEAQQLVIEIGLQHEQQHQELLVTDIKYILGHNPLFPAYKEAAVASIDNAAPIQYLSMEEGVYEVGHNGEGFGFDNEFGRHKTYIQAFTAANRLTNNGEYLAFINAGGYQQTEHWLSDGWTWVNENNIQTPMYWHYVDGQWMQYNLVGGLQPLDMNAPVTHISFYEATAYASWAGKRLLTEQEWEVFADQYQPEITGNFQNSGLLKPVNGSGTEILGNCWQWTNSAYLAYPGYRRPPGALGEYNGKFMINQMVLRGGSCATPQSHIRHTYRNFFQPWHRWQFTGIRLATDTKL